MVHIVVPLLVMFDCVFFCKHNILKYKYIILWEIPLIIYYGFINIYRLFGGRFLNDKKYPYDIINFEMQGIPKVIANCTMIFIIYGIIGLGIVLINKKNNKTKIKGV